MRRLRPDLIAAAFLLLLSVTGAHAQGTILQSGPVTSGHPPYWVQNGIQGDPGPASGSPGPGISEILSIERGIGTPPYVNAGSGPFGTNWCDYDAPVTNATGFHFLCWGPNAQGGGMLAYGARGGASPLPLYWNLNGTTYQFPFVIGGIVGPATTAVGDTACWNNTVGTLLADCGPSPNAFREIESGTTDTATVADNAIAWNSSSASGKTETLYACGSAQKGFQLYIKDEYGNAGTYSISLTPNGSNTIDKNLISVAAIYNLQGIHLQCNGVGNWIVK